MPWSLVQSQAALTDMILQQPLHMVRVFLAERFLGVTAVWDAYVCAVRTPAINPFRGPMWYYKGGKLRPDCSVRTVVGGLRVSIGYPSPTRVQVLDLTLVLAFF